MIRLLIFYSLSVLLSMSCNSDQRYAALIDSELSQTKETPNPKTSTSEDPDGWVSLFDGKTTSGWKNFNKEGIGSGWMVADGVLYLDPSKKDGGDIVTHGEYENFELRLEWKIQDCGNSGIMWNVQETAEYNYPWQTGPEMQILDNTCHPDAKIKTHRAGDLYDMIECSEETVKPAGEWNAIRIIQKDQKVEFWQNDLKVVSFTMHDDTWNKMVASSKFKDMKGFGKYTKGKISLQDHSDKVYFRNIKIKTL